VTIWLSQIPSWAAFVLIVAVANVVALAAMVLARRWSFGIGIGTGPAVVNAWATCVGAMCALLFAFTVISLWNNSNAAHATMDDEAAAMRFVARDLAPSQLPMLRAYATETVREWPRLCGGKPDAAIDDALSRLQRLAKPRAPAYADDLYRQLGTIEDSRNRRWQRASSSVPDEVWVGLVVVSLAVIAVLALAVPERTESHVALMVVVAIALGALFWVITVLEYPFCGRTGIGPGEIAALARAHLF
jgi:hypothetical protein